MADVASDSLRVIKNHLSIGFGGMSGREAQLYGGYNDYSALGGEAGYAFTDKKNYNPFNWAFSSLNDCTSEVFTSRLVSPSSLLLPDSRKSLLQR